MVVTAVMVVTVAYQVMVGMVEPVVMAVPAVMVAMVDRAEKAEVVGYGIESLHEYYKKNGAVITICSSGFFSDTSCSCRNG